MKFDQIIYENVKKSNLKRVRIKCDPRFTSSENFAFIDSYEGYILEEEDEIVKVMIIKQGMPTFRIPLELTQPETEPIIEPCNLCSFKTFIIEKLQAGDPLIEVIKNCQAVEEIESVLIQNNYTPDRVLKIYRQYINGDKTTLSESILDTLKTVGKTAAGAIVPTVKALTIDAGDTAQKINNFSSQLSNGKFSQVAKGIGDSIRGALDATKDKALNKLLKNQEWPGGKYPKVNDSIIIVNENNSNLNNKEATVYNIQKVKEYNIYKCKLVMKLTNMGEVECMISQRVDGEGIDDHSVNVRFTEDNKMSNQFNKDPNKGDSYVLQYNNSESRFEIVEAAFNTRGNNVIFDVAVPKDTQVGNTLDGLTAIASVGSFKKGYKFRGVIITPPEPYQNIWVAKATAH
jgi:hypothetical protein